MNNLLAYLSDYPTTNDYLLDTTHKARLPLMYFNILADSLARLNDNKRIIDWYHLAYILIAENRLYIFNCTFIRFI